MSCFKIYFILYTESTREELDYDDDDVEKNERKSQELACMDEPYYLPFERVPSSSRHLSQCPSSPRKKTIFVYNCEGICKQQKPFQEGPESHICMCKKEKTSQIMN